MQTGTWELDRIETRSTACSGKGHRDALLGLVSSRRTAPGPLASSRLVQQGTVWVESHLGMTPQEFRSVVEEGIIPFRASPPQQMQLHLISQKRNVTVLRTLNQLF